MKPINKMTQPEIAAFVQAHLHTQSIEVVLSGGAVVGLYSSGKYVSRDIDLVNVRFADMRSIEQAMEAIGFKRIGKYGRHFEHPESDQVVEFPPGPLSIGASKVRKIEEVKVHTGILKALSPTDCVRDRLAHYYHWNDRQCLQQAIMVADNNIIDLEEIRIWSENEGMENKFYEFIEQLKIIRIKRKTKADIIGFDGP